MENDRQVRANIDATLVALFRIMSVTIIRKENPRYFNKTIIDFWFRSTHDNEDRVRYWLTDAYVKSL